MALDPGARSGAWCMDVAYCIFGLRWLAGCLGLALGFMWSGVRRGGFDFYFSSSISKAFILAGACARGYYSMQLRQFLVIS